MMTFKIKIKNKLPLYLHSNINSKPIKLNKEKNVCLIHLHLQSFYKLKKIQYHVFSIKNKRFDFNFWFISISC